MLQRKKKGRSVKKTNIQNLKKTKLQTREEFKRCKNTKQQKGTSKETKVKNPVGRPMVMTEDVVQKLHQAFCVRATDEEACAYAEICKSTLYNFQVENPGFMDKKKG